jgi:hypothetical protein
MTAQLEASFAAPAHTPPHEPPQGAAVLDEVRAFVQRFAILPGPHEYDALALWIAHTHVFGAFGTSPRLAILSNVGEYGVGKTRVLDLLALLCARPRLELDPTGPGIAAMISQIKPTLLIDETDTIFGQRGSANSKRQLRGILNSGYRAGAKLTRRSKNEFVEDTVFCPVAFAGAANLPDSLMSRSVVIRMRRRRPEEAIDRFYPRMHEQQGLDLAASVASWARTVTMRLASMWPELPDGIEDRPHEIWSPLVALADVAGGHWPESARAACTALALEQAEEDDDVVLTPGQRLTGDLLAVWPSADGQAMRQASTVTLLEALFALESSPWSSLWDPAAAPREMAAMLRMYGIAPCKLRDGDLTMQGYRRDDFAAVWLTGDVPAVPDVPSVPDADESEAV